MFGVALKQMKQTVDIALGQREYLCSKQNRKIMGTLY